MKFLSRCSLLLGLLLLFSNFSQRYHSKFSNFGPLIKANVSPTLTCSIGNNCKQQLKGITKYHGCKIMLTGFSISFYQSNMINRVYRDNNLTNLIENFVCTKNEVNYSSAQLANNTTYRVVISHAQCGAEGLPQVTTSTWNGTICDS